MFYQSPSWTLPPVSSLLAAHRLFLLSVSRAPKGICVNESSAFEAAAVKNEAGRGNLSTLEGRGGVEAAAPCGTCEAVRDGADAASAPAATAAGRLEASRVGGGRGMEEREGVRRDFPLVAGSRFPVEPPPPPPPLVFDALQRCRLHFSLLFSLSRAVCVSAGVEGDDRTPIGARGE